MCNMSLTLRPCLQFIDSSPPPPRACRAWPGPRARGGGGGEKAKANKRKKKSYQVLCNDRRDGARGWNGKIGKKALSAAATEAHLRTTSKERERGKKFFEKNFFFH